MCDIRAVKRALDMWLIPDVVRIECLRELLLPGDIDYEGTDDKATEFHFTKIVIKLPDCVCGSITACDCPIWEDLGWFGVEGSWALSSLGFPKTEEVLTYHTDDGLTEIRYFWPSDDANDPSRARWDFTVNR